MNPAQRQTAEGILFTEVGQFSLPHLNFHVSSHKKLVQIDQFFHSYPNDVIKESTGERMANQCRREQPGLPCFEDECSLSWEIELYES